MSNPSTNHSLPDTIISYIITTMNSLTSYARTLSQYHRITQNQRKLFLDSAEDLENVRNKWQNGSGKCLSKFDIAVLYDFAKLLTTDSINQYFTSSSIHDRLTKVWSYILMIPDNKVSEVITDQSVTGLSSPAFAKILAARENTNLMINTVIDRNHNNNNNLLVLDIPTILLTIMIRSEAHEYVLEKILTRIQDIVKSQIDIPHLLSVVCKEPKGQQFKPDTRAIRDATAHAKFIIKNDSMGDFIIDFNNSEQDYSFQKTFSRKELLNFYQDYDRMTTIHTQLLTIKLLYSLLVKFVYI